jgi:hypothetical protein
MSDITKNVLGKILKGKGVNVKPVGSQATLPQGIPNTVPKPKYVTPKQVIKN